MFCFVIGLNGAMANINVGFGRTSTTANSTMGSVSSREDHRIHEDRDRSEHRKRASSSSSMDVSMDSPSRKKGRFL